VGELSRFTGIDAEIIKKEGQRVAESIACDHGVICVLKGHRTVITNGSKTYKNTTGNAAMATGGMGDVLTGAIAALLAQGLSPLSAAAVGVFLHGLAGDIARVADRGLLAREVAAAIPLALKKVGIR
jgi:NAD(P)H-hydrate epimerase